MDYKNIILKKRGRIAEIVLNRPEQRNSLTPDLFRELLTALKEVDKDDDVGVVFLRGAGEGFSAGMDLKFALNALEGDLGGILDFAPLGPEMETTIEGLSKPVIAAVHGFAIAGGFILSYFCDLTIATEETVFGDAHARWGLVPGWHEPQRLARKIGIQRAKELFLTGDRLSAKEAKDIGLIYKVFPTGKLDEAIEEVGGKFAKLSTLSIAHIKKQLNSMMRTDWDTMLKLDELTIAGTPWITGVAFTTDAKERLRSFAEKGKNA